MIRTIIVEDEQKGLLVLQDLIGRFAPDFYVCGTASHIQSAIDEIESKKPDLVFLDVQLADGNSLEVLRRLNNRIFELIFITAYDNYAVEAFRHSAIDYLLKPIGVQEFEEAVEKARKRIMAKNREERIDVFLKKITEINQQERKITVPTINGYELIEASEIIWCKSDGHYTNFYLANKQKLTSSRNLGSYEETLVKHNFCRINNGIMINMHFVRTYVKGKGGFVIMKDGTELEVSQRRKSEFMDKLGI